jgi:elongation factor Ts
MQVTPTLIKQLRDKTGAGMMECKTVLTESEGDLGRAEELLRKRGLARAEKLSTRQAKQGLIDAYVHGGRLGALVELNCETDFVAHTDEFRAVAHDVAMHVAAANPQYLDRDAIPAEILEGRRAEFTDQARADGKPEEAVEPAVQDQLEAYFKEVCLVDQPWVKDAGRTVGALVKALSAKTGENVRVGRFARFMLGE